MEIKILDREDPRPKSANSIRDLRFSFSQARAASFLDQYAFYSKPVYFKSTRPDISLWCLPPKGVIWNNKCNGCKLSTYPQLTWAAAEVGRHAEHEESPDGLHGGGGCEAEAAQGCHSREGAMFIWQSLASPPFLWGHLESMLALRGSPSTVSHPGWCCSPCHLIANSCLTNTLITWGDKYLSVSPRGGDC